MLNPDYRDILSAFADEGVEYLVVGAYALAVHGLPRATGDIDLWVRPSSENARCVWSALALFGAPLKGLTSEDLTRPGIVFQVGVAPARIDILTSLDGVEFEDAWTARTESVVEGIRLPVIGRRHLILNKKATARPQDLADVAMLEAGE